jgi:hypothetical protein
MNPAQRKLLEVVYEAFESAGEIKEVYAGFVLVKILTIITHISRFLLIYKIIDLTTIYDR